MNVKPQSLLGGRGRFRSNIQLARGKLLGKGMEGKVYATEIAIQKKERSRMIPLALKVFKTPRPWASPNFRRPEMHYLIYEALRGANREKNLGLRLPTTLRLAHHKGQPFLIKTQYPPLTVDQLNKVQQKEFMEDRLRQKRILKNIGYLCLETDVFYPRLTSSGKCEAIINDFGTIVPRDKAGFWFKLYTFQPARAMLKQIYAFRSKMKRFMRQWKE